MSGSDEFLIVLCIGSPAVCIPAKRRMLVALTLRGLGSKRCEDSISARIKRGEIVVSHYGTVGKTNSSANDGRCPNLKTQLESSSRSQREKKEHHGMEETSLTPCPTQVLILGPWSLCLRALLQLCFLSPQKTHG